MQDQLRNALDAFARLRLSSRRLNELLGPTWRFERSAEDYELEPGDVEVDTIVITTDHLKNAIDRALRRQITTQMLQDWANLILLFDGYELDLTLPEEGREALKQLLHEIASPGIFGVLSPERLREMRTSVE